MDNDELAVPQSAQIEMFADMERKPINLRKEMEKLGLLARHIKAKDLVGETFIIFKAKPFASKFDTANVPYFCHCTDAKHTEVWTTTLGGQAVTEVLSAYIALETGKPITVKLGFVEGGAYDGYYVFE